MKAQFQKIKIGETHTHRHEDDKTYHALSVLVGTQRQQQPHAVRVTARNGATQHRRSILSVAPMRFVTKEIETGEQDVSGK